MGLKLLLVKPSVCTTKGRQDLCFHFRLKKVFFWLDHRHILPSLWGGVKYRTGEKKVCDRWVCQQHEPTQHSLTQKIKNFKRERNTCTWKSTQQKNYKRRDFKVPGFLLSFFLYCYISLPPDISRRSCNQGSTAEYTGRTCSEKQLTFPEKIIRKEEGGETAVERVSYTTGKLKY